MIFIDGIQLGLSQKLYMNNNNQLVWQNGTGDSNTHILMYKGEKVSSLDIDTLTCKSLSVTNNSYIVCNTTADSKLLNLTANDFTIVLANTTTDPNTTINYSGNSIKFKYDDSSNYITGVADIISNLTINKGTFTYNNTQYTLRNNEIYCNGYVLSTGNNNGNGNNNTISDTSFTIGNNEINIDIDDNNIQTLKYNNQSTALICPISIDREEVNSKYQTILYDETYNFQPLKIQFPLLHGTVTVSLRDDIYLSLMSRRTGYFAQVGKINLRYNADSGVQPNFHTNLVKFTHQTSNNILSTQHRLLQWNLWNLTDENKWESKDIIFLEYWWDDNTNNSILYIQPYGNYDKNLDDEIYNTMKTDDSELLSIVQNKKYNSVYTNGETYKIGDTNYTNKTNLYYWWDSHFPIDLGTSNLFGSIESAKIGVVTICIYLFITEDSGKTYNCIGYRYDKCELQDSYNTKKDDFRNNYIAASSNLDLSGWPYLTCNDVSDPDTYSAILLCNSDTTDTNIYAYTKTKEYISAKMFTINTIPLKFTFTNPTTSKAEIYTKTISNYKQFVLDPETIVQNALSTAIDGYQSLDCVDTDGNDTILYYNTKTNKYNLNKKNDISDFVITFNMNYQ